MSKVQHQFKAPASQEDVDDEKAEADAGFIAADVEEMGVNGGTCINPCHHSPTTAPPLTDSNYSHLYFSQILRRRSVGCGADDHGRSEYVRMTES